jgi:ADP-ribose pyrophosphatase YjhB (NUDIX family)
MNVNFDWKLILAIFSTILVLFAYAPYFKDIFAGKSKPHLYTWLIWAITQGTATVALLYGGGRFGSISLIVGTILVLAILILSFRFGTKDITKADTASLFVALVAVVIWWIFNDPVISLLMVTIIDAIGFIPTIRKTHKDPQSETISFWVVMIVVDILSIVANAEYNFLTVTYLAMLAVGNLIVAVICLLGRKSKMNLIKTINLENTSEKEASSFSVREAARAVVFDSDKNVALLYSKVNDYYKLPGGGVEKGEDYRAALARECLEEIGCEVEVLSELGMIVKYRKKHQLKQVSYCYTAKVQGKKGSPTLTQDEIEEGFETVWIPLEIGLGKIGENKKFSIYEAPYMVARDTAFLEVAISKGLSN